MKLSNNKKTITDEEIDSLFKKKPKTSTAHFIKQASALKESQDTVIINKRVSRGKSSWIQFLPIPLVAAILFICSMIIFDSRPSSIDEDTFQNYEMNTLENLELMELEEVLAPVSFIAEIDPELIESINLIIEYKYEI